MGRVTVFSIEECPHCRRAKAALKEREIPYTEVSLTTHPNRRNDMLSISDRLTVPQVFFNERHVGGADDLLKVLEQWDNKESSEEFSDPALQPVAAGSPIEIYKKTIASQPDPTDPRLRVSTEPPVPPPSPPPPRPESDLIELPNGDKASVLQIMEQLKEILPHKKLPYWGKIYTNCFTGAAAVQAIRKAWDCEAEEAVAFGQRLEDRQLLHHVVYDHRFSDTNDYYFRLQCHQTPEILNSYRIWTEPAQKDVVGLVIRLKKLLGKVESGVTNDSGEVNYKTACQHELFPKFEEEFCELQTVDLSQLDRNTMIAFLLNLYNVGILYAFMKVGISNSSMTRSAFFTVIKFNVGGHLYSFQDLENGILRGNKRAPYSLSHPISKLDPRHDFVLKSEEVDCRIHFALNCGAKSCPPVKTFTADGIEEELRIVAQAFAEDDNNVRVVPEGRKIYLNKILSWYMTDFAPTEEELPAVVATFLRGKKKEELENMIKFDAKNIHVKFMSYDWGTNASDYVPFDAGNLQAQYYSPKALF